MKIIYSAYFCNPYWPSESMSAFRWMQILLERYHVIVFTTEASAEGIRDHYKGDLPNNLDLHTFDDDNLLKRKFKVQLYFGYFTFNNNIRKYIKNNKESFKEVKLILHKNPTSFRYFTYLYKLDKPLVIGPITGGIQVPKSLKTYFKTEPFLNKLRKFDRLLLKLPVYKKQYQEADRVAITFDYVRESLPKTLSHKVVNLLETGIEINNDFIEKNPIKDKTIKVLWVGKLVRYKGAELAIRSIAKIKHKNVHLDILGNGVEFDFLQQLISKLNLNNCVTLHGNVPHEEVDKFYKNADIFCFPTIKEAFGNVLLEAMKYGLPIVTLNNGGPKYVCPDAGTFKIPFSSLEKMIDQISEKLSLLIDSPGLRNKMGKENYLFCKQNYSWNNIKKQIFAFVDNYQK